MDNQTIKGVIAFYKDSLVRLTKIHNLEIDFLIAILLKLVLTKIQFFFRGFGGTEANILIVVKAIKRFTFS